MPPHTMLDLYLNRIREIDVYLNSVRGWELRDDRLAVERIVGVKS